MLLKFLENKWVLVQGTNQEKMFIQRSCVGIKNKGTNIIIEDNIFNRIVLERDLKDLINNETHVVDIRKINPLARDYQIKDIERMVLNKYNLNRNKPGYGKTFETIEYCRLLGLKKILIICPKSVTTQWAEQFKIWWPKVEQHVVVGGMGPRRSSTSIFVTNYEQIRRQSVRINCKQWIWDVIVSDESHRIKNPKAQITVAIKDLPSHRRMLLTGTPILSKPNDLWSQFHFMDKKISGREYWTFVEKFCEVERGDYGNKILGLTQSKHYQELLKEAVNLITVGGNNHKVTEGKNLIKMDLEMPASMKKLYRAIVNLSFNILDEEGITVKNAMDQIVKQQQCTTNIQSLVSAPVSNPKFEWIRDWLEDNSEEKLVVFSKYAETIKSLEKYLTEKCKINCTTFVGSMSEKSRTASKEKFVQLPEVRVMAGTIGALGTGVDGLQHVCRNVVFLDRDWTPGINEQAEDRVNRSGQEGMTNIWILNMKSSIDEYVEGIQNKKDEDIRRIFENVSNSIGSG